MRHAFTFLFCLLTLFQLQAAEEIEMKASIDAVGSEEEEGEVAESRLDRDAPMLYERNKWEIERKRERAYRRERCQGKDCYKEEAPRQRRTPVGPPS